MYLLNLKTARQIKLYDDVLDVAIYSEGIRLKN